MLNYWIIALSVYCSNSRDPHLTKVFLCSSSHDYYSRVIILHTTALSPWTDLMWIMLWVLGRTSEINTVQIENDISYKPTQLSSHNLFKPSDQDRKIDRFSLLCYTGPQLMVTQVPGLRNSSEICKEKTILYKN